MQAQLIRSSPLSNGGLVFSMHEYPAMQILPSMMQFTCSFDTDRSEEKEKNLPRIFTFCSW